MADMLIFNNIFKNDGMIDDLITYLKTKRIPSNITNRFPFLKRAKQFSLNKSGNLILTKHNLEVVKASDRNKIMTELYNDIKQGSGKGILAFYKLIVSKYINIRRSDVDEFLKKQAFYQLQQPLSYIKSQPITATYSNQLYAIDLIDMELYENQNSRNRYILTIVDVFSGKCWLGKMTQKTAKNVAREFERVCEMYPTYILCDNGTEFQGEFLDYCKDNDILVRNSSTYSPVGTVESKNKQVRKVIRDIFIRTKKLNWTRHLKDVQDNLNNTYNSRKKATPNELWTATTDKVQMPRQTHRKLPAFMEQPLNLQQKEVKRMEKLQDQYDDSILEVGQKVRVMMSALYSDTRRIVKQGKEKLLVVKYSPDIYTIVKVVKPRKTRKLMYYIENADGVRPNRSFSLSQLQPVDANANAGLNLTTEQAMELNKTWFIDKNDNIPQSNI
jgi:hypothetical protein